VSVTSASACQTGRKPDKHFMRGDAVNPRMRCLRKVLLELSRKLRTSGGNGAFDDRDPRLDSTRSKVRNQRAWRRGGEPRQRACANHGNGRVGSVCRSGWLGDHGSVAGGGPGTPSVASLGPRSRPCRQVAGGLSFERIVRARFACGAEVSRVWVLDHAAVSRARARALPPVCGPPPRDRGPGAILAVAGSPAGCSR
jgi:hypothetical protein